MRSYAHDAGWIWDRDALFAACKAAGIPPEHLRFDSYRDAALPPELRRLDGWRHKNHSLYLVAAKPPLPPA